MSGFHEHVGVEVESAGGGDAVVRLQTGDQHLNAHGTVHGGAIATLVDTAMGAAVAYADDRDSAPVTIEMKVTYLEPGQPGELVARATVRKRGKRLTIVEAEVTQNEGEDLVALALATFTS
jgi:uncharacterized protein (TIGR00369 family)